MQKFISSKIFIAVIFFCVGFMTNHLLVKMNYGPKSSVSQESANERFPIDPKDFDHDSIQDAITRMQRESGSMDGAASTLGAINEREDEKNVYYEIPLTDHQGVNHNLNVEIKDGAVRINEDIKGQGDTSLSETTSERMFSIDPRLNADKAEVTNEKDKIIIKIPKK